MKVPDEIKNIHEEYGFGLSSQAYAIFKLLKEEDKIAMLEWFKQTYPYTLAGNHALEFVDRCLVTKLKMEEK